MKNIIINTKVFQIFILTIGATILINSCNKPLPEATPIDYPPVNNSTTSIGELISSDTSYSFFAAAATRTGQLAAIKCRQYRIHRILTSLTMRFAHQAFHQLM